MYNRDKVQEARHSFQVGSTFKGCQNCGVTDDRHPARFAQQTRMADNANPACEKHVEVKDTSKTKTIYLTGTKVRRSYDPARTGWTFWCPECGATDKAAWGDTDRVAAQIGKEPVIRPKQKFDTFGLKRNQGPNVNDPRTKWAPVQ